MALSPLEKEDKERKIEKFWLTRISERIVKNKIKSLKEYNDSIWMSNPSANEATLLSNIAGRTISEKEIDLMVKQFFNSYAYLFFKTPTRQIHTDQNISFLEIYKSKSFLDINTKFTIQQLVVFQIKLYFRFHMP